ncbi:MAG TPA: flagellar biosynthetic protein FliR [Phenylobacterium sp.]|jgi:flagellar biosynthetic protein FliR|nr:flagellar biosynthetic protein FliR [Phenylobacterium sp.]
MEHYAPAQQVFAAGLIFARLGPILMLIPGFGETFVPVRIRLSLALLLALVLFPVVGSAIPPIPGDLSGIGLAVIKETAIGLMIGTILRMFMSSLSAAGEFISIQTTLGFAQTANPTQATPSTTISTFLGLLGLVLIMSANLHHMFLSAIVRSYTIFPFTRAIPVGDANTLAIQTVSKSFALGLQLAAPVVAFSLIFNVAIGLVGRVMPQFQIFFVASPLMILLGLSIFATSLGLIGMVWLDHFRDLIALFG